MIFICDNQFPLSIPSTSRDVKASTYKEAGALYKSLYYLADDILENVEEINILIEGSEVDEKSILKVLKQYSANIEDYPQEKDIMVEIWDKFPDEKELRDTLRRTKIERFIQGATVTLLAGGKKTKKEVNALIQDSKSFLFISSHTNKNCLVLLESLSDNQVTILIERRKSKNEIGDDCYPITKQKYLQLEKELVNAQEQYDRLQSEPWRSRDYTPDDPLRYFENGFYRKLDPRTKSSNTKVHFYGQDEFLADRAIKMILMGAESPKYFSMPAQLEVIETEGKPTVILNFDKINDPNSYYKLHERVKSIEDVVYVVLQAIRNVNSKYFSYYETIEIPNQNEIRKHITGIFISFLADHKLYRDDYWKLAILDKYNLLQKVIPHVENLEMLYKCLKDFSELTFKDLLYNVDFWFVFEERVKAEIKSKLEQPEIEQKRSVSFVCNGDNWEVYGLGNPIQFEYSKSLGIKYIAIIVY